MYTHIKLSTKSVICFVSSTFFFFLSYAIWMSYRWSFRSFLSLLPLWSPQTLYAGFITVAIHNAQYYQYILCCYYLLCTFGPRSPAGPTSPGVPFGPIPPFLPSLPISPRGPCTSETNHAITSRLVAFMAVTMLHALWLNYSTCMCCDNNYRMFLRKAL